MKAVVFDMDGLMFDTESVFLGCWDVVGERMGLGKTGYMLYRTLGKNVNAANEEWRAEFGDRYDEETMWRYTREYMDDYYARNHVKVKKGLNTLLEYLCANDVKIAVASSTARKGVERHLHDSGVYDYFDTIVCGDMIKRSKPDPDIYLRACEELGVKAEESFALEDSRNGLLAACRAGCRAIMVPDLWQPDEEILGMISAKFDDLEQVKEYFAANNVFEA